jgi:hypothetical protein
MALTPNEKLHELKQLHAAITSHRNSVLSTLNNRTRRHKRMRNCIARIRDLTKALKQAVAELVQLRDTESMHADIDACNARLAILHRGIIHWQQRVRIARLLQIKAQMEAMNMELPAVLKIDELFAVAPAEPDMSPEPDDDMIVS